ncbi:hypothetical protein HXA34_20390 [Salipaludibacillus agaradhaerens]|jgi:TusA-related sulfurtransferase|uniref:hypothetical protein n=1 Tax=Salipaludibacillus agaradhaerens TaxID=76935 RepID=UPI002150FDBC|nr:hypothetical protein [Salipaludibacillus agaradhaerens]MCR6108657.1 hypothetical protein [Salipaludibacillus agaradhaerens]MCR6120681.1 hypothetical protein [Salipaludibacillus agaradhaerens]
MEKKIAGVTLRVCVIETEKGKELSVKVECEGTNHDIMDVCEFAQHAEIIGESGVEKVVLSILNEDDGVENYINNETAH